MFYLYHNKQLFDTTTYGSPYSHTLPKPPRNSKGAEGLLHFSFFVTVVDFPSDRDLTTYAIRRPSSGIQTIQYNTIPNENKGSANESMRKAWAWSELEKNAVWRFEGGEKRKQAGYTNPRKYNKIESIFSFFLMPVLVNLFRGVSNAYIGFQVGREKYLGFCGCCSRMEPDHEAQAESFSKGNVNPWWSENGKNGTVVCRLQWQRDNDNGRGIVGNSVGSIKHIFIT